MAWYSIASSAGTVGRRVRVLGRAGGGDLVELVGVSAMAGFYRARLGFGQARDGMPPPPGRLCPARIACRLSRW